MWDVMFLSLKSSRLFFLVAIILLLRQEVVGLLESSVCLSKGIRYADHRLPSISLRERPNDKFNDENEEGDVSELDKTVREQQEKIDMLIKLMAAQSTNLPPEASTPTTTNVPSGVASQKQAFEPYEYGRQSSLPPLKAMLFIDGTWLYYSIHEREGQCPIQNRFGKAWQYKFDFEWSSLPRIICQALQEQESARGWGSQSMGMDGQQAPRPIEITRVSVFTSYKADTPKTSFRYQMFQDMLKAKFDVHMMETVGRGEKCVDIQLAVDMLHYATVPDAYDVAVLLTGDKDFMPAMSRCRQKGRRVGLVSMRSGCNRALIETPNLKDFDAIWLEDYLEKLVIPKNRRNQNPSISELTLITIVLDFISSSGMSRVSSRDIGKYIKRVSVGERRVLDEVKQTYGGLYQFLIIAEVFVVEKKAGAKAFWVGKDANGAMKLRRLGSETTFTDDEKRFFDQYDLSFLQEGRQNFYFHSLEGDDWPGSEPFFPSTPHPSSNLAIEKAEVPDYSSLTVVALKEICRDRDLPVSGKKADLIDRIIEDDKSRDDSSLQLLDEDPTPEAYLEGLMTEYLHAKGGQASSRDVGRYLQANKASKERCINDESASALIELKEIYGSIKKYTFASDKFQAEEIDLEDADQYEFAVRFADRS